MNHTRLPHEWHKPMPTRLVGDEGRRAITAVTTASASHALVSRLHRASHEPDDEKLGVLHYGHPAPGAGASMVSTCPVRARTTSGILSMPRHSAAIRNNVLL